eukprot:244132-Chlamydomonas_euryale.AAC.30
MNGRPVVSSRRTPSTSATSDFPPLVGAQYTSDRPSSTPGRQRHSACHSYSSCRMPASRYTSQISRGRYASRSRGGNSVGSAASRLMPAAAAVAAACAAAAAGAAGQPCSAARGRCVGEPPPGDVPQSGPPPACGEPLLPRRPAAPADMSTLAVST